MEIKTIDIAGFAAAFTALRLPFGLETRSDIAVRTNVYLKGKEDLLGNPYPDNRIGLHSVVVMDEKDLARMSDLVKNGDEHAKVVRGIVAYVEIDAPIYFYRELETYRFGRERLSSNSTMHQECKGMKGLALQKAKAEIEGGHMQKTVDMVSYQTLRRMIVQRYNHRLPEWHELIDWIITLPYANELILVGLQDKLDIHDQIYTEYLEELSAAGEEIADE